MKVSAKNKRKTMEKEKEKYAFEFQEFMAVNKISLKAIPKSLKKRVKAIDKIEQNVKENCTLAHYKIIKSKLEDLAHEVAEDLYELFDEKIKGNALEDIAAKDNLEDNADADFDKKVLKYSEESQNNFISSKNLQELGLESKELVSSRFVVRGNFAFHRLLGSDAWKILKDGEVLHV